MSYSNCMCDVADTLINTLYIFSQVYIIVFLLFSFNITRKGLGYFFTKEDYYAKRPTLSSQFVNISQHYQKHITAFLSFKILLIKQCTISDNPVKKEFVKMLKQILNSEYCLMLKKINI